MTRYATGLAFALAAAILAAGVLSAQERSNTTEARLRATIVTAPKPAYPPALLARKIGGVAVASVLVGTSGKVETVVVLEAPDPLMAEAVRAAIQQWTFQPARSGPSAEQQRPATVASKLTFYFSVQSGAGVVRNPEEMPGVRFVTVASRGAAPARDASGPAAVSADISSLEITRAEFDRRAGLPTAVVLDPRDRDAFRRGHREGALNIPRDELEVRGPIEIPAGKTILVDCTFADPFTCMVGALRMRQLDYQVAVFKP